MSGTAPKVGDVVTINGGGRLMVVFDITTSKPPIASCSWIENESRQVKHVLLAKLVVVPPEDRRAHLRVVR